MGKRRQKRPDFTNISKKQKKHLKEFGEQHPFDDHVAGRMEHTQVVRLPSGRQHLDSESDEEVEEQSVSAYEKLLSTMSYADKESSEEEEEEEEDDLVEEEDADPNDLDNNETDQSGEEEDEGENEDEEVDAAPSNPEGREVVDAGEEEKKGDEEEEQEEDFTDKAHEAEFCLESNLPAESEETAESSLEEDMFVKHLGAELSDDDVKQISEGPKARTPVKWSRLGSLQCVSPLERFPSLGSASSLPLPSFHKSLEPNWRSLNQSFQPEGGAVPDLTDLQKELLKLMASYRDVYYPECSAVMEGPEVRRVYCLHVLNHVLKANSRVLAHNSRLKEGKRAGDHQEEEFRDQGLTRPKVLILVPFRDGALKVVQNLISLLQPSGKKMDVSNKKRFKDEYGEEPDQQPPNLQRPDDYHAVFSGNVDDHFRLGISILKRSMRLYSPFYSSDIIIASPLGLRTLIGAEGEAQRDFDFLSSIEMLVLDQTDVFLMQNWEHVLHVMEHMNLQPLDSHGVDFSRVRMWNLNNWGRYYRQTLVLSSIQEPQINNVLSKCCHNYRGHVATKNLPQAGSICQVLVQLPHVFQMFKADTFMDQDARFQFFVDKVLPQYQDALMSHTLIYVPSYFDFVRLRNFLKKEDFSFTCISEYSQRSEVSRARHHFQTGEKHLLLFSERFHFYKRYTIKGIRNLVFYALPTYAHFYSEVCNMLQPASSSLTCSALYSRYDAHKLAAITGAPRAARMLNSNKSVHLFITGEEGRKA